MLEKINLLNFKSFRDVQIPLSNLTLLSGLNNSGKSSLIQAIRMVNNWIKTNDPTLPEYGSLEEMKNINASKKAPIEIEVEKLGESIQLKISFTDRNKPMVDIFKGSPNVLPLICHLSAERWGPRTYLPTYKLIEELSHVGEYGEYVLDFLARHELDDINPKLRHRRAEGDTLEWNVREWLTEVAPGVDFKHAVEQKRDTSYATINGFRPPNTGFGLSYTLPVIVMLLGMTANWTNKEEKQLKEKRGILILLENPEAHLHPKGQTIIGELIAVAAASGVQIIVETHSEHVMDGIRIAVKNKIISNKETVFHYFKSQRVIKDKISQYETAVETPKLNQNGKLDFWPEGFFDQTLLNRAKLAGRR
jgi:predicted ATPase